MRKLTLVLAVLLGNIVAGHPSTAGQLTATIYKSPYCGCCTGYAEHLRQNGYHVTEEKMVDLAPIKQKFGINAELQSCHTTIIGGYAVEGHVPLKFVDKLLSEKPGIKGIALPGMPSGVPGMPGNRPAKIVIYTIDDNPKVYATE